MRLIRNKNNNNNNKKKRLGNLFKYKKKSCLNTLSRKICQMAIPKLSSNKIIIIKTTT